MLRRTRLQRKKPLVARAKPRTKGNNGPRKVPVEVRDAQEAFKVTVCSEPCIGLEIPGHICDGPLQAMHVVPKQTLRRRGLHHLRYDPVNAVAGCERIHTRHDLGVEKISRALLPERCILWARAHGVLDSLERHWPGTPFDDEQAAA
jgi:hypothetical protein